MAVPEAGEGAGAGEATQDDASVGDNERDAEFTWQLKQKTAPASEYIPVEQGVHAFEPESGAYDPAAHALQLGSNFPVAEYVPGAQLGTSAEEQLEAPSTETKPEAHAEQEDNPDVAPKNPGKQPVHHVETVAPVTVEKVPAGHLTQLVEDEAIA